MDLSDDDREKLSHWRNEAFATLVLATLQLVGETHPELLRQALASAFDLAAIEAGMKQVLRVASDARLSADEARELLAVIDAKFDALDRRLDALNLRLDQAALRIRKAEKYYGNRSNGSTRPNVPGSTGTAKPKGT
jgi:hypothetical protein